MKTRPTKSRYVTVDDVRQILTNPVYGYGINFEPVERVTQAVMQLNQTLARQMQLSNTAPTLAELDQHFQALFQTLEESGRCTRTSECPPIVSRDVWLESQQIIIERLSRGEEV